MGLMKLYRLFSRHWTESLCQITWSEIIAMCKNFFKLVVRLMKAFLTTLNRKKQCARIDSNVYNVDNDTMIFPLDSCYSMRNVIFVYEILYIHYASVHQCWGTLKKVILNSDSIWNVTMNKNKFTYSSVKKLFAPDLLDCTIFWSSIENVCTSFKDEIESKLLDRKWNLLFQTPQNHIIHSFSHIWSCH